MWPKINGQSVSEDIFKAALTNSWSVKLDIDTTFPSEVKNWIGSPFYLHCLSSVDRCRVLPWCE